MQISAFPEHLRRGFAFPPVSQAALARTERMIGFAHPPLLRDLYLHVANGGFGPGKGLTGVPGGYSHLALCYSRYTHLQETLVYEESPFGEEYPADDEPLPFDLVDLEQYEHPSAHARLIRLGPDEWPNHCVHLCAGNYVESFYVHVKSGYVYMMVPADGLTTHLHRQADSLEEWFELWLAGELEYGCLQQ